MVRLDGAGLDWMEQGWIGWSRVGLDGAGLDLASRVGLDGTVLDWMEQGWVGLD